MAATSIDTAPLRLASLPVLVVDDDAASAKTMSVILRGEGCDVRIAVHAEDALAQLRTFQPRLIVLDLVLPMMSGLLLAQRLKAKPETRDIVLIAVTVFNGREAAQMALAAGCSAYVHKPVDADAFIQLVLTHFRGAP
jgi:CheY-like chemotaxis protein